MPTNTLLSALLDLYLKLKKMIKILPLADIMHEDVLLEDDFSSKFEGWELIEDGDYVNFEIEVLIADQIEEYKKLHPEELSDSFKKMQVLKSMLDAGLITLHEYSIKREAILKTI